MQTTSDFHHKSIKVWAQIAKDIVDDTKNLDPTRPVFNTDAVFGADCIGQPFFGRQVMSFGLLGWLKGLNIDGFMALKPGIFP